MQKKEFNSRAYRWLQERATAAKYRKAKMQAAGKPCQKERATAAKDR